MGEIGQLTTNAYLNVMKRNFKDIDLGGSKWGSDIIGLFSPLLITNDFDTGQIMV